MKGIHLPGVAVPQQQETEMFNRTLQRELMAHQARHDQMAIELNNMRVLTAALALKNEGILVVTDEELQRGSDVELTFTKDEGVLTITVSR